MVCNTNSWIYHHSFEVDVDLGEPQDRTLQDPTNVGLENFGWNGPVQPYVLGRCTVGQLSSGHRIASQGAVDHLPPANDATQKHPQTWIGPSSTFQEPTMLLSNHPVQTNPGEVGHHVPATASHAMEPRSPLQTHPPWPCDTSYAPCVMLRSASQVVSQPVMLFMGYPPAAGSTAGLVPYTGPTPMTLSEPKAAKHGFRQTLEPDHYTSSYATTVLPGSTIPGSSTLSPTYCQTPRAARPDSLLCSSKQDLDTLAQGTALFGHNMLKLTGLAYHINQPVSSVEGCITEPSAPIPFHIEGFQRDRTRRARTVSKQPAGVSKAKRTLLPKP